VDVQHVAAFVRERHRGRDEEGRVKSNTDSPIPGADPTNDPDVRSVSRVAPARAQQFT
jgi:hypothetical protein